MRLFAEKDEAASEGCAVSPCIASATISLYNRATLLHPWFHRKERRGKVGINNGSGARSSSWRRRRFLFEGTVDSARTDPDELSNLLFVVALPIQLPDPFMHTHPLTETNTTLLCDFLRHCRPGSRMGLSSAAPCRFFEHAFLLAQ